MPTRWLRLTLGYDGTDFAGWQVQPNQRTVQGELETAWQHITGEQVATTASGRTDAGVHARAQVAGLQTHSRVPNHKLRLALNTVLPRDVVVTDVATANTGFHATHDALSKTYRYRIHDSQVRPLESRPNVWHVRRPLDTVAMQRAALLLCGRRNFACFESSGSARDSTIRTVVACQVIRTGKHRLDIEVTGDGFLYNMVRTIAGTLVEVGRGARAIEWVRDVVASRDRRQAGQTAPAHALVLWRVDYGDSQVS